MKKALCVGINDYPVRGSDLRGCVNDAKAWAALLEEHYGFDPNAITMLLDKQATKAAIVAGITSLLAGTKRGDVLVFTNSSHGTYVADDNGDETRYDEAICPYDMKQNLLVDDEFRALFGALPSGVRLTVISDSCFSGSVTRDPGIETPDDRRQRFVSPAKIGRKVIRDVRRTAAPRGRELHPETKIREVLLSGCNDKQYSFDARFGTTYHGAMSYFAHEIIKSANYQLTYEELWDPLVVRLQDEGYDQEPQLEGKSTNKQRPLFT